ncbi:uncharacterized protein CTRU02_204889 [Colletotrichum truncatum]|uniref:Uncharacterized protein n=1 Tax=Colletotrichum truncatum TaxID=5467 RepID=A0ACC3Z2H7_COLTU
MIISIRIGILAFATIADAALSVRPSTTLTQSGCTTTVTEFDPGFTGDYKPTSTITIFNKTITITKPTDCHGCDSITTTVEPAPFWGGIGPQIEKVIFVYATTPTTVTTLACATSTVKPDDP